MRHTRLAVAVASTALVLASCSLSPEADTAQMGPEDLPASGSAVEGLSVVVTTTVLGSVVGEILTCALGDSSSMTVLMPRGADPHDFQASSAQVALMAGADLVVANGLGLEEGVTAALDNLETDGVTVLQVASLLDPLPFAADHSGDGQDDHHHDEEATVAEGDDTDEHAHGDSDPHFWFDMTRMARAAQLIGAQLAQSGDAQFASCGDSVAAEILEAEADVAQIVAQIPDARRVLVTDHDALGYFADRYDFEVVGVVIPGGSTLGEANSQEMARLITVMREENVSAIFGDSATSPQLLETLSAELGGTVAVVELFVGSLGAPDSGADTYIEMMRTNATRIASALAD